MDFVSSFFFPFPRSYGHCSLSMQRSPSHNIRLPRVDLGELKSQLAKKLGPERARRYFSYLHRLLSQNLSKAEFNKLCFLTLGRENVPLHNLLIQSVIKNAFQAKIPPPLRKSLQRDEGLKPPHLPVWSNEDILPESPRRPWSDTQSKLGFSERADVVVQENGHLVYHDLKRIQGGQDDEQAGKPVKICQFSSAGNEEVLVGEGGEFMEQNNYLIPKRAPLEAPLGIPFYSVSVDGFRRSLPPARVASIGNFASFLDNGELCHTEDLRKRMEMIVGTQGLAGVSLDSANLLNIGLNVYLKQLIKSSMDLVGARVGHKTIEPLVQKEKAHENLEGLEHMCNSSDPLDLQERNCCLINLQEFTVAMRLNPRQLREDAPLSLEKILLHSCED